MCWGTSKLQGQKWGQDPATCKLPWLESRGQGSECTISSLNLSVLLYPQLFLARWKCHTWSIYLTWVSCNLSTEAWHKKFGQILKCWVIFCSVQIGLEHRFWQKEKSAENKCLAFCSDEGETRHAGVGSLNSLFKRRLVVGCGIQMSLWFMG